MKNSIFKKIWLMAKGKVSIILIISMVLSGLTPALNVSAKNFNYQYVDELEIDDTLVDDGMFYIPHESIEVTESDSNEKYIFKVKKKGEAKAAEKVKLTMVDITAKYDRDYSIKVIDKSFFSENVENKNVAQSANEYLDGTDYEEYNYSDAIIDGSVDAEDIMTEEEIDNYEITDEDKKEISENLDAISDSIGVNIKTDEENASEENNKTESDTENNINIETTDTENGLSIETTTQNNEEGETTTKENIKNETISESESESENASKTVSSFTGTENETNNSSDETKNDVTSESKENEEKTTTREENTDKATEESTNNETSTEKESIKESTTEGESTNETKQITKENTNENIVSETESDNKTENNAETTTILEDENKNTKEISTASEINNDSELVYSEDTIAFENINKATMSISEGFEMATGLTDDRKIVLPDRSAGIEMVNKNSLSDMAYMNDSIKIIEEELKSAYVILSFKEGQTEKLIEVTIKNDKKYSGDRQVGFNLSEVDGSLVAGMYSSVTLIIHDDEEEVPEYINFSKKEYSPKDGYITVEIERSGHLGNISTCMLDTEDITAVSGRDYSQVHAKVVFAMGINKRTVKIPISSTSIKNSATFKLKLQEPAGALIGDTDTAICTIKKTDVSFNPPKKSTEKIDQSNNNLFGSPFSDQIDTNENNNRLFGSSDYNMNSIITTTPINLQNAVYSFTNNKGNSNSYFRYINGGNGLKAYIENHDIGGETASFSWGVDCGGRRDISGYQINWAMSGSNNKLVMSEYMTSSRSWRELGSWTSQEWGETTNNYFISNPTFSYLWFNMYRYDGWWRTSPTFTINSISPILRMYHIINVAANVPKLIDANGNLTSNHKYANYAVTSIEGAQSDHTAVGWSGKKITVKLDQNINNPFYIKRLLLVNDSGATREIAKNNDTEATTITFEINNSFVTQYDSFIRSISRAGGGRNGEFKIQAELGTKKSVINIAKDKRVDVNIWHKNPTKSTEEVDTYEYNVGDILHFFANVKSDYTNSYDCHGLNVYYVKPFSPDYITIRRPTDDSDYFPLDSQYSEIKVVPALTEKNTGLKVRINKSDYNNFDKNYGIFKNIVPKDQETYYEYTIEKDSAKVAGKYFDLKAKCIDDSYTPIWYENSNPNVKYTQNTYYFLGTENQNDNIVFLTIGRADSKEYSISGKVYYEEVPIGGKSVDQKWQPASSVGILVDDTHYGYSDSDGSFETVPGKGINNYYKKIKIVSNGANKYMSVKLSNKNTVTKEYRITYDSGEKAITKTVYVVALDEVLISNIDKEHPHITGVKVLNQAGSSFSAVYINDNITRLQAFVVPKKPDGSNYTYTYVDENGIEKTANETIKRVEFVAVDMNSHTIKKVIEATRSNADKTEWEAIYVFKKGYYQEYQSGDKLYVRIVTDKKVGDGKGDDIGGSSSRIIIPIFNETTYQALPTAIPFIEQADMQPDPVDINFINNGTSTTNTHLFASPQTEPANKVSLPILGGLSTMINAIGISFSIQTEGDRIRIYIGKKFKGKGNHYDGNGKPCSDTGYAITLDNFDEGLEDMKDFIKTFGTKRLKTMTLGIPAWSLNPIAGIYFEFVMYKDAAATSSNGLSYEFTGGGGYVGAVLNLRYTFYFLVYGIPCYVGGEVDISLVGEFGMAVDEGTHIMYEEPSQDFFDKMMNDTHFEFVFKAKLDASAYAGVGICGVVGIRGGFTITLTFLYNPFVKKKFANVRPVGFSVTGAIKLWADAIVLSIPIPIYKWPYPYNLGYFEDIQHVTTGSTNSKLNSNYESNTSDELKPRPRSDVDSRFVANNESHANNLFGATYELDDVKTIIDGVYDASEPSIIKYNGDKALLVYLDDDHSRGTLDRTVLRYTIYDGATNTWSNPQNIWSGNDTADFSPNLCDAGDKILVSWSSRPTAVADDVSKDELIKNMEIYTAFFDKTSESFSAVERMTEDNDYDYYPKAVYDNETGIITLYYLKKDDINSFNTATELLNNIQPEVNGAQMMYMIYDNPDGAGNRWLRDYYYPYEFPASISDDEKNTFINTWRGQRFANLSIDIGGNTDSINNPAISDYDVATAKMFDSSDLQTEIDAIKTAIESSGEVAAIENNTAIRNQVNDFISDNQDNKKLYKILCYITEPDGNLNTKNDTEIFIKIRSATESEIKTIRVTHNDVHDSMPKIISNDDNTYLFWIQNESTIKSIDLNDLIHKSYTEDHANTALNIGEVHIKTIDNEIIGDKITNFYPFVDDDNNIYIVWQQDSAGLDSLTDNFEIEFKQDLYAAGFVKTTNASGNVEYSWSNPVRLTNNGKVNNLPTTTYINDKLLMVNNEYNLISNDKEYDITNSTLNALTFAPKSSLYINGIQNNLLSVSEDGSATYESSISLHNSGLSAAKGFDYTGSITYNGQEFCTVSGGTEDYVLPGNETMIGSYSNVTGGTSLPPIRFTLSSEQRKHLDKLKLTLNIVERNVGDTGKTSSIDVFDVKEAFSFATYNENEDDASSKHLRVTQEGESFVVTGILKNSGNTDTFGNEKIYVIDQEDWDNPIATSEYLDLKMNDQYEFSIPIDNTILKNVSYGIKDLVVYVKNDDGVILSDHEIATIDAKTPFNFKVNGDTDTIKIKVGETIKLNTTYEPDERYRNATILYAVDDQNIAYSIDDKITGITKGETTLKLTTKEFGGTSEVKVIVSPADAKPKDTPGGGGGGNGGGGGIGGVAALSYVSTTLTGNSIYNNPPSGSWDLNPYSNSYRYALTNVDPAQLLNGSCNAINIGGIYYLSNGIYKLGSNGNYYMFDNMGTMLTGLQNFNGAIYYFEETGSNMGAMATGERTINGLIYNFNELGIYTLPSDGVIKVANGEWIYHPLINKWSFNSYTNQFTPKNPLKNGIYSIKDYNNSYVNYYFDANGFWIG